MATTWILLALSACLVLAVSVDGKEKERWCYHCQQDYSLPGLRSHPPKNKNCLDPFEAKGIKKIKCHGACYKQQGYGDDDRQAIVRGCWESDNPGQKCESRQGEKDKHGVQISLYCCDNDSLCNTGSTVTAGLALIASLVFVALWR